jgi:poly-gamma-glutamate synthesis protein (capsule biosynthesis protein)
MNASLAKRTGEVVIHAVGDVFIDIPDGASAFRSVKEILASADIVVGNCEGVYCDRPARALTVRQSCVVPQSNAKALAAGHFTAMCCANNHMLDGGYDGLADTLAALRSIGIQTFGAGADLEEAFRPAIVERNGIKVAFLGVCSVFPVGAEARQRIPGLAPLRVQTAYHVPDANFWEPELEAVTSCFAMPEDLAALKNAIAKAKQSADVVIVSCHWGVSVWYDRTANYEIQLAREIVELGADLIVCHHHHNLRGIQFHRGVPIFHGLGAFAHHMTTFDPTTKWANDMTAKYPEKANGAREGFPYFPFNPVARMTGIFTFDYARGVGLRCGLIPAMTLGDGSVEPLRPADPRVAPIVEYLAQQTRQVGGDVRFEPGIREGYAHVSINAVPTQQETK